MVLITMICGGFCKAWVILYFYLLASHWIQANDVVENEDPFPTTSFNQHSGSVDVAALEGRIYLFDANSAKIIYSFALGTPVYSSYQAELSDFFIDIGDDWELYSDGLGSEKVKHPLSIEDLLKGAPVISSHGEVLSGSEISAILLVDSKTGKVLFAFVSEDELHNNEKIPLVPSNGVEDEYTPRVLKLFESERLIYVVRNKFVLKYRSNGSWYLMFAETESSFYCEGSIKPMDCQSGNILYRVQNLSSLQRLFGITDAHPRTHTIFLPAAYPIEDGDWFDMSYFSVVIAVMACMIAFYWTLFWRKKYKLNKQAAEERRSQVVSAKKKKSRKSNKSKNGVGVENLRKFGNVSITNKEIGKGSNGTVVWEGIYNGRRVAVKRLIRSHHDIAKKEVANLISSDDHQNIVRFYGIEYDEDFVYLSLELCDCSLYDFICLYSKSSDSQNKNNSLQSVMGSREEIKLWRDNGHPSTQLLDIMRDFVCGVAHLHEVGIIHRDLKPHNVLIIKKGYIRAKVSDMGISKRLPLDMSTLTESSTGGGTPGWQAPEQLQQQRQTRSIDLFSLGCSLFFCLTGGRHPFGEGFERVGNIVKDKKDLFLIAHIPEAVDLISQLLDPNPSLSCLIGPKAVDVLHHPLCWDAEKRLSFLRDVSDRLELEDQKVKSDLLIALEKTFRVDVGGKWDAKMDAKLVNDLNNYRRYKPKSVRDLLRAIRNKFNHYAESSQEIKNILGQPPEEFYSYFSIRFPKLLIEVYKVFAIHCREEESFSKYFGSQKK